MPLSDCSSLLTKTDSLSLTDQDSVVDQCPNQVDTSSFTNICPLSKECVEKDIRVHNKIRIKDMNINTLLQLNSNTLT